MPRASLLLTLILCAAGTIVQAATREIIPAGMLFGVLATPRGEPDWDGERTD